MASTTHNPERRAFKGRSYKRGGVLVSVMRQKERVLDDLGGELSNGCSKCGGRLDDGGTCESPQYDNCDRASLTPEPA
jgi:hypothetical protein